MKRKKKISLDQLSKPEIWILAAIIFAGAASFLLVSLGLAVFLLSRLENKLIGASLVAGILLISFIITTAFYKLGLKSKTVVRGGRITEIAGYRPVDAGRGGKQKDWVRLTDNSSFRPLILAVKLFFFTGPLFLGLVIALLANELLD